jgi:dTDP-glucose pyrophosphorylase
MIVIPMLGKSSRFFEAGYRIPKFMLLLGNKTVFYRSLSSFSRYFESESFVFIVRKEFDTKLFVESECKNLGIKNYVVYEYFYETSGQAESVFLAIERFSETASIVIFNIDTIRTDFTFPTKDEFADGFLEVFIGEGTHWSFIKPLDETRVELTAEKKRISSLCSNGMYGFASIKMFKEAFFEYKKNRSSALEEVYIAPLYNYLIAKGRDIRYRIVDRSLIKHCGTPVEYENSKLLFEDHFTD